jgi:hypothetical protein
VPFNSIPVILAINQPKLISSTSDFNHKRREVARLLGGAMNRRGLNNCANALVSTCAEWRWFFIARMRWFYLQFEHICGIIISTIAQ